MAIEASVKRKPDGRIDLKIVSRIPQVGIFHVNMSEADAWGWVEMFLAAIEETAEEKK